MLPQDVHRALTVGRWGLPACTCAAPAGRLTALTSLEHLLPNRFAFFLAPCRVFTLDQMVAVHEHLEGKHTRGKVGVRIKDME